MHPYLLYFTSFELILFSIPILPEQLYTRLAIIAIYFIGHVYKIQLYYARFKYYMLHHYVNRWDDPIDYNYYFNLTPLLKGKVSPTKITSEIVTDCLDNKKESLENIEPNISKSTSEICGDDDSSDSSDSSDNIVM
jgi:hypothetical protein